MAQAALRMECVVESPSSRLHASRLVAFLGFRYIEPELVSVERASQTYERYKMLQGEGYTPSDARYQLLYW